MDQKIKITLAEDHALMRRSLIALLHEDPSLVIVGDVANGRELLNSVATIPTDVVIMDLEMPVMNGWEALKLLQRNHPDVKVIVLSMYTDLALLERIPGNGIHSYLSKGCTPETLFEAIHSVFKKGYFYNNSVSQQVLKKSNNPYNATNELTLNDKEKEILIHICDGKTNKEIATIFQLSPSTIDFHRTKIYNKANCSNVVELFKYALKTGIISVV